jgi:hypothetical protein
MEVNKLESSWDVSTSGYRWAHAKRAIDPLQPPERALVPARSQVKPGALPAMREMDSSLFRIFADVQPDEGGILAFANKYGNLLEADLLPMEQDAPREGFRGSLLRTWQEEITHMLRLVNLWDMLHHKDRDSLFKHIKWVPHETEGVAVYYSYDAVENTVEPDPKDIFITSTRKQPELITYFNKDPFSLPGWVFLWWALDLHVREVANQPPIIMVWDPLTDRPVLSARPLTLLSAVWLQFALAVSSNRIFDRCRVCHKWFEVAPDVARSNRRFCSNACRSKAFRERQGRARQLHAANKSFDEIAKDLDSDVATVKRWITGSKE